MDAVCGQALIFIRNTRIACGFGGFCFYNGLAKRGRFGGFGIVELVPTSRRRCNSRVHKPRLRSDHARFPAMWEFHEQGLFFKMWLTRGCVFPSFFIFEVRVHKGRGRDV